MGPLPGPETPTPVKDKLRTTLEIIFVFTDRLRWERSGIDSWEIRTHDDAVNFGYRESAVPRKLDFHAPALADTGCWPTAVYTAYTKQQKPTGYATALCTPDRCFV